jgi:hypothetical protein
MATSELGIGVPLALAGGAMVGSGLFADDSDEQHHDPDGAPSAASAQNPPTSAALGACAVHAQLRGWLILFSLGLMKRSNNHVHKTDCKHS